MSAEAKLHSARQELLDLGLRNPLLNYRTYRARGLEIMDEKPAELHTLLVHNHTPMAFLERPDSKPTTDDLPQPAETDLEDKYTDDNLQTPYDSAILQKRLLHTYHTAHTYLEEHGVNILYLALGMLHWYESDSSDKRRRAPLVLIPVQLDRLSANEKFRVAYTFEEVSFNLSLEAKLRIDYGLQLPPLPAGDDFAIDDYFAQVETLIADQPRWSVDKEAAVIAFFSFTKLLMFNDLDPANWPEGHSPAEHPVIQALLSDDGFLEPPVSTAADTPIDQRIELSDSHHVMNADSSQALAILDVNDGRNLVIQGPPGTGKSQTITNIIAEAVGNGKTVLFVSEKMAALNVVKRRLDGLGLGDGALELHSHKATKGSVMAELGRTMALGRPKQSGVFTELTDLMQITRRLNDYAAALNTPIRESGITPYEAYGRVIQLTQALEGIPVPEAPKLVMFGWSADEYTQYRQHIRQMQEHLGRMGTPAQHPFYGSLRDDHQPDSDRLIRETAEQAAEAFTQLRRHTAEMARQFGLDAPQTVTDLEQIITLGEWLASAPNLFALDIDNDSWYRHAPQITAALDAGSRITDLQNEYDDQLIPAAWTQDVLPLRQPLAVHGERLLKFLSREYREAKNKLLGLCRQGLPENPAEQLALVDAILEVQEHYPTVKTYETLLAELFGARWNGLENTKWYDLLDAGYWTIRLHKKINEEGYPAGILPYLGEGFDVTKRETLVELLSDATIALEQFQIHWRELHLFLLSREKEQTLDEREQQLRRYAHEAARFGEWVSYQQLIQVHDELALLWPSIEAWAGANQHLVTFFDYHYYQQLIDITLSATPILGNFEGQTQETAVELFQHLDEEFLRQNRYRLAYEHWQRLPQYAAGGQVGLLQSEAAKSRNHLPIRQLITAAGPTIQRLKPIFMMSPLSVAMFLPPGLVEFDLVVFDEASQVRPVDAFGAIVRGRQVVVVGDSRQLPPTSFFDRVLTRGEENGESEELGDFLTENNESILDLFVSQNAPQRMLRWHYRSRHESLIAISNREFYHNQLILFPSPDATRKEVGLKLRHLPHTVYDRGGTRTNRQEAQAVAQAVMAHARTQPHLTLGVAAFSSAQREAIENELEKLRRASPETEPFFDTHTAEPFFVKNLENVQGDERDVIFISIGYGRDAAGKVNLNFGPLNPAGGERRLNVLITRSRRRCEVFTNFTAADIDLRRTASQGVAALKAYLAYAESGELEELAPAIPHTTAPFEQVIVDQLTGAGYSVDQDVGNNGVVVDLAVRDPREPERYLLGILCDGESYGRALYARDRDRIQPNVLNALGWHIQRVWSTSWVNGPQVAAERLIAAVHAVANETYTAELAPRIVPIVERYAAEKPQERKAQPYQQSSLRVDLYNREGWQPGEHVGQLKSVDYYQFDVGEQQFVNKTKPYNEIGLGKRLERLDIGHKRSIPEVENPGTIYARLTYDMNTGRFTLSDGRGEFLSGGKRFYAFFDHTEERFYAHQRHKALEAKSKRVPVSRELAEAVRLEAQWVVEIVRVEGPLHQVELERRLAAAGGLGRRTALMENFVKTAGTFASERGLLKQQGDFWWPAEMLRPPVRDRSKLPSVSRKLDYVADEEIAEGVKLTVEDAIAMRAEEIVPAVRRLLGFGSLGRANQERIVGVIAQMLAEGRLTVYGEEVTLPETSGRRATEAFIAHVYQTVKRKKAKKKAAAAAKRQAATQKAKVEAQNATEEPERSTAGAETIAVQPYGWTTASFEPYKQEDWTHVEAGRFISQHFYRREPESGRFVMAGRLAEKTVMADFERYQHEYSKLVFDRRLGVFYEQRGNRPLVQVDEALEMALKQELLATIVQIVQDEGPLHYEQLSRSLAHAAGRSSRSHLMVLMAEWSAQEAVARGLIQREGAFFWPLEMGEIMVRNRAKLPKVSQKWAFVAPAEIAQALVGLAGSGEQTRSNAPTAVADLLGLSRPRGETLELVKAVIENLIEAGHVREESGVLKGEPAENHILTLREAARLAELTEAEGDIPEGQPPNLYLISRPLVQGAGEITSELLADAVTQVVENERPVHREEVVRRLVATAGLTDYRLAEKGIAEALAKGAVKEQGQFLWPVGVIPEITVRVRTTLPTEARLLRYVADEELAQAILELLAKSHKRWRLRDVQKALVDMLGIMPLTSLENYRVSELVKEMKAAGLLQQIQEGYLIVAEEERFRGADGLPTAAVAPEIMQAGRPYERSPLKIEEMLAREGWQPYLSTELISHHYYRFDVKQWCFVYEWLPDASSEFANLPYAYRVPAAGKIYAQLLYDLEQDAFSVRPYMFYLKTEQRSYRLNVDPQQRRFYLEIQRSRSGNSGERGYYFIDPDSGEAQRADIREIGLSMVNTRIVVGAESLIETQLRRPDVARIEQIVQTEQPLHEQVLAWRFAEAAGLPAGNQVAGQLVANTIAYMRQRYQLRVREGIVTERDGVSELTVRNRSELTGRERQLRLVAERELQAAVLLLLAHGSYLRFEDVATWVVKVLGVRPLEQAERTRLVGILEGLLEQGKVKRLGNFWVALDGDLAA